ncbi:hypothetical protein FGO68_gene3439 [Halteria grandinella]|uniref:Uncharacterized protein n=1 Tax=Halteria grandinella TaxID=5974 RepID=A0A8J8NEA9_HALGN|nr:hypothetical protein FGO68_gene3439 [Halteria grandinella]
MDITNGNVLTVSQIAVSTVYYGQSRLLLILDNGKLIMGDTQSIYKITPPSTSARQYTIPGYYTVGLQSNTGETNLHAFSFATNLCMITVMDMSTFSNIFQKQVQCKSTSFTEVIVTFQSCMLGIGASSEIIAFQEGSNYYKISNNQNLIINSTNRFRLRDDNVFSLNQK